MNKNTDIQSLIKDLENILDPICDYIKKHLETERFFKLNNSLLYAKASILREIMELLMQEDKTKESKN